MKFSTLIFKIFWNKAENRLRAVWRLAMHAGLVLLFTTIIIVFLFTCIAIFDVVGGRNLQDFINGESITGIAEMPWVSMGVIPLAVFLGTSLATIISGKWVDRRKIRTFGFRLSRDWWFDFAFGLGLGAVLMGLVFTIGWLSGFIEITGYFQPAAQNTNFISGFLQAMIFFVLVGIYEEVFSRGYQLVNLAEGLNRENIGTRRATLMALFLSSLIFGLLHIGNPNTSWVSMVNITLAGMLLGLGMVLTGNLAIPIGLHISWNFFQGNVFGFPVSGINAGPSMITVQVNGPEWLTGGNFGPEAGALGLGAMIIGGFLIFWWVRRIYGTVKFVDLAIYEPSEPVSTS